MDKTIVDVIDKLGAIAPILQIGVVVVIVIITIMTYAKWLGAKFPAAGTTTSTQSSTTTSEVSFMYFQGWFKSVLDGISELRNNQETNRLQLRESFGDELRKTRHDLKGALASVQAELMTELEQINKKQKEMTEEFDKKNKELVEAIEELQPVKRHR